MPARKGMEKVTEPNTNERFPVRRNWARSISNPAKNIISSLPISEKNMATGAALGRVCRPLGPRATPASNSPTTGGTPTRRQSGGTSKNIASTREKRTSRGKWTSGSEEAIMIFASQIAVVGRGEQLRHPFRLRYCPACPPHNGLQTDQR